jgi:Sperm-tail PG-rich repeat
MSEPTTIASMFNAMKQQYSHEILINKKNNTPLPPGPGAYDVDKFSNKQLQCRNNKSKQYINYSYGKIRVQLQHYFANRLPRLSKHTSHTPENVGPGSYELDFKANEKGMLSPPFKSTNSRNKDNWQNCVGPGSYNVDCEIVKKKGPTFSIKPSTGCLYRNSNASIMISRIL